MFARGFDLDLLVRNFELGVMDFGPHNLTGNYFPKSSPHKSLSLSRLLLPLKSPVQENLSHDHVDNNEPGSLKIKSVIMLGPQNHVEPVQPTLMMDFAPLLLFVPPLLPVLVRRSGHERCTRMRLWHAETPHYPGKNEVARFN